MPATDIPLACPRCWAAVRLDGAAYLCVSCASTYPVLFGIPDFRLRSDRYLSLEQEREKARRLHEYGQRHTFDEMVAYYYSITDDVPPALVRRYQAYIQNAPRQAATAADALELDPSASVVLDAGCGAGGFLIVAARRCRALAGTDIALRWLVICKKRLEENNVEAMLICADVESLPFPEGTFTHVAAGDLIEHVYHVEIAIAAMSRQLVPGGRLWLAASNRYCIGPQPSTRIWGIGFLPHYLRTALLLKLRGVDSLRFFNLVSPLQLSRICRSIGFCLLSLCPRQIPDNAAENYPLLDRLLIKVYRFAARMRPLRFLLILIGPAFEMLLQKPGTLQGNPASAASLLEGRAGR